MTWFLLCSFWGEVLVDVDWPTVQLCTFCLKPETLDDYLNLSFVELYCAEIEILRTLVICYLISTLLTHVPLIMVVDLLEYAICFSVDPSFRN